MPVRKISNGGRKNIGKFPSRKNGRAVIYESLLERDFMFLAEADSDVISYQEQPIRIHYELDNVIRFYTPDFLVVRRFKKQIVEVKPERKAKAPEFERMARCVSPIFRKMGYEYIVMTERQIRWEPRLSNIKLLQKYSQTELSYKTQLEAYAFFKGRKEAALCELLNYFAYTGTAVNIVYALIYFGALSIDLNTAISPGSIVRLSSETGLKEKTA